MKKYNEIPQQVYLNCTIDILCVLQPLESKITKTEPELQYLEDVGTQHKINSHGSKTVEVANI